MMVKEQQMDRPAQRHIHSHTWIVGVVGLIAGLVLLVYVPSLKAISNSLLLFAGFHLVGGAVVLLSIYSLTLRRLLRRVRQHKTKTSTQAGDQYDFGWGPEWMNGLAVVALVAVASAIALQVAVPQWWPVSFILLLAAVAAFAGNTIMRSFQSHDHIVLPMVNLLQGDHDVVLDAGCGSGRTSIALSRILRDGRVVAVDRFDADYIDDGGRGLLERNLHIAGLTQRVQIKTADLTHLPFEEVPSKPGDSTFSTISSQTGALAGSSGAPVSPRIPRTARIVLLVAR